MSVLRDFQISVKYAECKAALQRISDTELPEAIAAGINRIASGAAAAQRMNLRRDFILRNKYTEGSLAYYKANPKKDINRINAIVGSKQPYLALQEQGGTEKATGKKLAMPTVAGRGGSFKNIIPKNLALRAMGQIKGTSQRFTKKGNRVRGKGFFILGPGPSLKAPAIFYRRGGTLHKIRLLGKKTQKVKARHWHRDAVNRYATTTNMQMAFIAEARRRIAKYQA